MSQSNAIPPLSRPSASQTSGSGAATGAAFAGDAAGEADADGDSHPSVQGRVHDHNRPFPPPRLSAVHPSAAPNPARTLITAPLSPISSPVSSPISSPISSTFRSRPRNETDANNRVSADTPPRSPLGEVSLTVPRPDGERAINEYVEAPFKHCCNQDRRLEEEKRTDCPKIDRRHRQKGVADGSLPATHRLHGARSQGFRGSNAGGTNASPSAAIATTTNAVTKQPVSFTKEPANSLVSRTFDPAGLSIMCNFCGRCRCESCREPPPLPSKWLCDNKCFCSADTVLDYASCLCCVKGLFYHCADGSGAAAIDGEAGGSCADDPCSCTGSKRVSRWACLGALALVMPCLLCYWPLKGCVALCEICYARHAAQGCRCNPSTLGSAAGRHHPIANDIGDSRDPEKRLLDPVTPEL